MDLPHTIVEQINQLFNATGTPYSILENGHKVTTSCLKWPLPVISGEELNPFQKYTSLARQYLRLIEEDKNDPRVEQLKEEIDTLLRPYRVTYTSGIPVITYQQLLRDDPYKGIHPFWWKARELLSGQPAAAFRSGRPQVDFSSPISEDLIVLPSADPYDFLLLHQTGANQVGLSTGQIIQALKELDQKIGIVVVNAGFDLVEFICKRKLSRKEAQYYRGWLIEFCPTVEEPWESLLLGRITLWWD